MASTVRDLNELLVPATNDYFLVADTSDTVDRDKKMQLSKVPMKSGTPVAGRVAEWVDANFVQAGSYLTADVVTKTGMTTPVANNMAAWNSGSVLKDAGFAISDVARLSIAQSYSALHTFNSGINVGQSTLAFYEAGNWTPTLTFGGASTGMTGGFAGRYTRLGPLVIAVGSLILTNKGSATGNVSIGGLPYPTIVLANMRWPISIFANFISYTGQLQAQIGQNGQTAFGIDNITEAGTDSALTNANFANNSFIHVTVMYQTP